MLPVIHLLGMVSSRLAFRKKIEINETDFLFWELMIAENFEHRLNLILIGILSVDDVKKI